MQITEQKSEIKKVIIDWKLRVVFESIGFCVPVKYFKMLPAIGDSTDTYLNVCIALRALQMSRFSYLTYHACRDTGHCYLRSLPKNMRLLFLTVECFAKEQQPISEPLSDLTRNLIPTPNIQSENSTNQTAVKVQKTSGCARSLYKDMQTQKPAQQHNTFYMRSVHGW